MKKIIVAASYLLLVMAAAGFSKEAMPQSVQGNGKDNPAMVASNSASQRPSQDEGAVVARVSGSRPDVVTPRGNAAGVVTPNRGLAGRWQNGNTPPVQTPNRGNAANFHAWGRGRVPVTPNQ